MIRWATRGRPGVLGAIALAAMVSFAGCVTLPSTTENGNDTAPESAPNGTTAPGPPATSSPPVTDVPSYTDVPPPPDRPDPGTSTTSTTSTSTQTSSTQTSTTTSNTSSAPAPGPQGIGVLDDGSPFIGAWLGQWPNVQNGAIADFEDTVGQPLDVVDVYLDWFTPVKNVTGTVRHIQDTGATASLTWEAQTITTPDILKGTRTLPLRDGRDLSIDAYLAEFAEGLCAAADGPVILRILHEMNGGWFAWGITYRDGSGEPPNTPESYKQAWIKIHDAFDSQCGDQVRLVWAVNHNSVGEGADFTNAYPGDAYVDYVAIDVYNWGAEAPWGWKDFEPIFRPPYCALTGLTDKPLFLAETGSSENGGDKAQWIRELFAARDNYTRLNGLIWLNDQKPEQETGGTIDWRVESSPEALEAFRDGAAAWHDVRDGGGTAGGGDPC